MRGGHTHGDHVFGDAVDVTGEHVDSSDVGLAHELGVRRDETRTQTLTEASRLKVAKAMSIYMCHTWRIARSEQSNCTQLNYPMDSAATDLAGQRRWMNKAADAWTGRPPRRRCEALPTPPSCRAAAWRGARTVRREPRAGPKFATKPPFDSKSRAVVNIWASDGVILHGPDR
jgi:hypothetical protein